MTDIEWLQAWYISHCDGEWEHHSGVKIDTLDNPGWTVEISIPPDLVAQFEGRTDKADLGDADWLICRVENERFLGVGDPSKLSRILSIFREWCQGGPIHARHEPVEGTHTCRALDGKPELAENEGD